MKNQAKKTELNKIEQSMDVDVKTGLTNLQEQAAFLLTGGKSITETASFLSIARNTIYNWQEQPFFNAYCNRLSSEIKKHLNNSLFALWSDAVETIKDGLKSESESIRLKSAFYIIDNIGRHDIDGAVTARGVIVDELVNMADSWMSPNLDAKVDVEMKKRGLE